MQYKIFALSFLNIRYYKLEIRGKCTFLQCVVLSLHPVFLSLTAITFLRLVNSESVLPSDPTHAPPSTNPLPNLVLRISAGKYDFCRRTGQNSATRFEISTVTNGEILSSLDSPYLVFTPFPLYLSAPQRLPLVPTVSSFTLTRPEG